MVWPFRKPLTNVPDDIDEARRVRREVEAQYQRAVNRAPAISQISATLAARRELNHFGDTLQITFTRKQAP